MAAACGPVCHLSTTLAPKCPLHFPPTPATVILGLSSQVAVLGPPHSLNQAPISHLLLPPLHHLPHRLHPLHCRPTQPWPSRFFPGWKSVVRRLSRKTVHPATTLAMVCSNTPVSVGLSAFALISPTVTAQPTSLYLSLLLSLAPPVLPFLFHFPSSLASLFLLSHIPLSSPLLSTSSFQHQIPREFTRFLRLLWQARFPQALAETGTSSRLFCSLSVSGDWVYCSSS